MLRAAAYCYEFDYVLHIQGRTTEEKFTHKGLEPRCRLTFFKSRYNDNFDHLEAVSREYDQAKILAT